MLEIGNWSEPGRQLDQQDFRSMECCYHHGSMEDVGECGGWCLVYIVFSVYPLPISIYKGRRPEVSAQVYHTTTWKGYMDDTKINTCWILEMPGR